MKRAVVILCLCFVWIIGCKKEEELAVESYHFAAGSVWNYQGSFSQFNFRPTRPGILLRDTTLYWNARVDAWGEAVLHDSVRTWRLRSVESFDTTAVGDNYYLEDHDSVYLYAYSGSSFLPLPKESPGPGFRFRGHVYRSM